MNGFNIARYNKIVAKLVAQARGRLRGEQKPAERATAPFIHESEPFPQQTICKRCQLEPVANFFNLCYSCRVSERLANGRNKKSPQQKYDFAGRSR